MSTRLLEDLPTPALIVDVDVLERNIATLSAAALSGGFVVRPHGKAHKCLEIARRQLGAGAVGLTAATVAEAEVFAQGGVSDLFVAYPLWVDDAKAARLRGLADSVALRVGADSVEGVRRLGRAVRGAARPVQVMIEIDCGHHRTGVTPEDARVIGEAAGDVGLEVAGVFTFPGHGYGHHPEARERAARDEERALGEAADALRAVGIPAPVVSGGSTPTVGRWRPGVVNELRPGVYVFNDATQLAIGTCSVDDLALSASATVVSTPDAGRFVLDVGSKVLGSDRSPWVRGHGYLPDFPGAVVASLSEHHATVVLPEGIPSPALGARVSVVPNHVCTPVNLADVLIAVQGGKVVDEWHVAARGANT